MSKENNGFIACPFCGRADRVVVMDEDLFYKFKCAVTVRCKRCDVEMVDNTWTEKNYEKRVDILRRKWNKRAAMPQETEGEI